MQTHKLVTIARYQNVSTANLAKNKLEMAGIASFLADAETINTDWLLSNALGGVKLQVEASDADRAREQLSYEMDHEGLEALDQEAVESADEWTEPHGTTTDEPLAPLSEREELAKRAWRGALLSLLFFPFFLLIGWMVLRIYLSDEPLGQPYRRQAWLAGLISFPFLCFILWFISFALLSPFR